MSGPITRAARALELAVSEHGAPNTFAPKELWMEYGADMAPMEMGRNAYGVVHAFNQRTEIHGWHRARCKREAGRRANADPPSMTPVRT